MDLKHFDPEFVREPVPGLFNGVAVSSVSVEVCLVLFDVVVAFEAFLFFTSSSPPSFLCSAKTNAIMPNIQFSLGELDTHPEHPVL